MAMTTTGTLIAGVVKLDESVDIPNNSRVTIQIRSINESPSKPADAWARLKKRLADHPIHAGGLRYTRDELHERR